MHGIVGCVRHRLRAEPWPPGESGWRRCAVCDEPWRPWAGSRLPCHARCFLSPEEQESLLDERARIAEQAERLGVTIGVIRASHFAALKRRAEARDAR